MVGAIVPVTATTLSEKSYHPLTRGNTLYVGGSGPGNYTTIQEALDASADSDTVFVYDDSAPYYEALTINHSITLAGENQLSTIINGSANEHGTIVVNAAGVMIRDLTVEDAQFGALYILANHTMVTRMTFRDCAECGILAINAKTSLEGIRIEENTFTRTNTAFYGYHCNGTIITRNDFDGNTNGIALCSSFYANVSFNQIVENDYGYTDYMSGYNQIYSNNFRKNSYGVDVGGSYSDVVARNNFIDNTKNAFFGKYPYWGFQLKKIAFADRDLYFFKNYHLFGSTLWRQNYWDATRTHPYLIIGETGFYVGYPTIPRIAFDKSPAQYPYNIP